MFGKGEYVTDSNPINTINDLENQKRFFKKSNQILEIVEQFSPQWYFDLKSSKSNEMEIMAIAGVDAANLQMKRDYEEDKVLRTIGKIVGQNQSTVFYVIKCYKENF